MRVVRWRWSAALCNCRPQKASASVSRLGSATSQLNFNLKRATFGESFWAVVCFTSFEIFHSRCSFVGFNSPYFRVFYYYFFLRSIPFSLDALPTFFTPFCIPTDSSSEDLELTRTTVMERNKLALQFDDIDQGVAEVLGYPSTFVCLVNPLAAYMRTEGRLCFNLITHHHRHEFLGLGNTNPPPTGRT
ncbi:hypothetical protein GALMADRAFT_413056 [Galerina marginata CBS 339.88]|uniref:Uncharacterized protein n=1 Tax=Galerina marginata (strain CBS 339.88) TaxID=685588 RepID=A0A067T605_GALM3|nr:hypothetical protein GALMADRAFT_413056 [Galerina marginata CBS 339.88]